LDATDYIEFEKLIKSKLLMHDQENLALKHNISTKNIILDFAFDIDDGVRVEKAFYC
jgi:hypothetical protein